MNGPNGKMEGYWDGLGNCVQALRDLRAICAREGGRPHDWGWIEEQLGMEEATKLVNEGLARNWAGNGVGWRPWGLTQNAQWIVSTMEHGEKGITAILETLNGKAGRFAVPLPIPDTPEDRENKPWDWEWIKGKIGAEESERLRGSALVKVEDREWDGKGNAWTPWRWTNSGAHIVSCLQRAPSRLNVA